MELIRETSTIGYDSQQDFVSKQDSGGYPFQLHLMFTEKNRARIMRSIKADTTFLKQNGIMDYSLLLICEEIEQRDEQDIMSDFASRNSLSTPRHNAHDEEDVIEGQLAG